MIFRLPDDASDLFPDPSLADPDGCIAVGGDLSPERLVSAYSLGIFPWPLLGSDELWWFSPHPRMVLTPTQFRCSKSLCRTLRSHRFTVCVDTCFEQVIRLCAATVRDDQPEGTWINDDIIHAYCQLHELGLAHSFETFLNGQLVGGLYGVSLGQMFFGESMFHTVTDASKVAFARLVEFCLMHHFCLIDAQQQTAHLASLGAAPIPRADFLARLRDMDFVRTLQGRWGNTVILLLGSNQGDRQQLLQQAVNQIDSKVGWVSDVSRLYETEPWGFDADQPFLNVAVTIETKLAPVEVLRRCMAIEQQLGRVRPPQSVSPADGRTYSSRPIDIDVMFYNSEVIDTPTLQVPHPRMCLRRFALSPLNDLCPDFIHPVFRKTLATLLSECADPNAATPIEGK